MKIHEYEELVCTKRSEDRGEEGFCRRKIILTVNQTDTHTRARTKETEREEDVKYIFTRKNPRNRESRFKLAQKDERIARVSANTKQVATVRIKEGEIIIADSTSAIAHGHSLRSHNSWKLQLHILVFFYSPRERSLSKSRGAQANDLDNRP